MCKCILWPLAIIFTKAPLEGETLKLEGNGNTMVDLWPNDLICLSCHISELTTFVVLVLWSHPFPTVISPPRPSSPHFL